MAGPVAAADGLTETAATLYTVNPAAGRLDVQVDITVKNTKASVTSLYMCLKWVYDPVYGTYQVTSTCERTTDYYVNETFLWLESTATAIKATANAGSPKVTLYKKGDGYNEYRITFKAVYKGQTRNLHVTYQIRGGAPRTKADTRIGAAHVSFCVTSNGYDGGSTRVVLASSYDVTVDAHNGAFTSTATHGSVTYATPTMPKPEAFWACFDGDNLAGFKTSSLSSPGGRAIEVQAWPEDSEWHGEVTKQIEASLGKLEALIGRPLPGTGPIVVREVSDAGLGAYVGTFDAKTGVARVSEDFTQPGVVAHELSHAWFNDSLFDGRWLSEGSAGWAESTITNVPCPAPGAFPGTGEPAIATWTFAGPRATAEELDVVDYEYAASCYIVASVASRVGPERMRDVLAALLDRTNPYRSDGLTIPGPSGAEDWRGWLDAVDELGLVPSGVDDLDYAQGLLLRYGATSDGALLTARSEARVQYHEIAGAVGAWILPEAILRPMGAWRFGDAIAAMRLEAAAFARVRAVTLALPDVDAENGPVRELVASAEDAAGLQTALDRATDQETAAQLVAGARADVAVKRDAISEIGLLGTDLRPDLVAAIGAVASIDLASATDHAARIQDELAAAPGQGLLRIGIACGLLLLIAIAIVVRRRRRRRRRIATAALIAAAVLAEEAGAEEPSAALLDAVRRVDDAPGPEAGPRVDDAPGPDADPWVDDAPGPEAGPRVDKRLPPGQSA